MKKVILHIIVKLVSKSLTDTLNIESIIRNITANNGTVTIMIFRLKPE